MNVQERQTFVQSECTGNIHCQYNVISRKISRNFHFYSQFSHTSSHKLQSRERLPFMTSCRILKDLVTHKSFPFTKGHKKSNPNLKTSFRNNNSMQTRLLLSLYRKHKRIPL